MATAIEVAKYEEKTTVIATGDTDIPRYNDILEQWNVEILLLDWASKKS